MGKTIMHPEVATIATTLEALDSGAFEVPQTPGVTEMILLVFRVPYKGSEAIGKVRVSRQMIAVHPCWKQWAGKMVAEDIRALPMPL